MSPGEVVGSRDGCCYSIAESTVDVPIRLFWQISVLALCCSRALLHNPQLTSDRCLICGKPFGYWNFRWNCYHFSPFMSPRDARVVQIFP